MRRSKPVLSSLLALAMLLALTACSTVMHDEAREENWADGEIYELYPTLLDMDGIDPTLEFCSATMPSAVYSAGDINGDGRFSIADIVLLNAYVKEKITLTSDAQAACDCTGNGVVDNTDVRYLQGALLGHTLVITPGKLPTCTDGGLSEGIACSNCQIVLVAQSTLNATGHTFIDGACHCGATDGSMMEEPTIVIGSVSGVVGDEVEIAFELVNSPALYAMSLKIGYDDTALQLVSQQSGGAMEGFTYTKPSKLKNGARFMWYANDPAEADGTILKLTFKILDSAAAGEYTISMTNDMNNTYDEDGDDVAVAFVNGSITVVEAEASAKSYTVIFKDYDGTTISTQTVFQGESAEEPAIPQREGYLFSGWDTAFDHVSDNLTVTATYTKITGPTVVIENAEGKAGDEVTVRIDLMNSPSLYALSLKIGYDDAALQLVSQQSGEAMEGFTYTKPSKLKNGARFMWYANDPAEADGTILKLTFKILDSAAAGEYTITMVNDTTNTYDANDNDVDLAFVNGNILVTK